MVAVDKLHPLVLMRLMYPRAKEIAVLALEHGLIDFEEFKKEYERWEGNGELIGHGTAEG